MPVPPTFGVIVAVAERSDGGVVVTDGLEKAVFVLDSTLSRSRRIGRAGDGPGEYRGPGPLIRLGGDSLVVVDRQNRKWYQIVADRFVRLSDKFANVRLKWQADLAGLSSDGGMLEVRSHGHPISLQVPIPRSRPGTSDSVAFVLHKAQQPVDTIGFGRAYVYGAASKRLRFGSMSEMHFAVHPLQSFDQALLFPDGTVAVARLEPYRVEWRDAAGKWKYSAEIADTMQTVTAKVKSWVVSHYALDADGNPKFSPSDFARWPARVPAFTRDALVPGADGRLYVTRTRIDDRQLVDVFEGRGSRVRSVRLPIGTRLISIGNNGWYLARPTPDGEEELIRWVPS